MNAKTTEEKLDELRDTLQLLADACNQYNKTKNKRHLISIAQNLRALVCTGSRNFKPLLLDLADELNINLTIYSTPPRPDKPREGLIRHNYISKSWSPYPEPPGQLYQARDWLTVPFFFVPEETRYVSRNELLRGIADKSGAHFDDTHATSTVALANSTGSEMDGRAFFLLETGCAVLYLGEKLLRLQQIPVVVMNPQNDSILQTIDEQYARAGFSMGDVITVKCKTLPS
jgi:hypothetical protein